MFSSPLTRTFSGSRCIAGSIAGCFFITHSRCAPSTAARRPLSAKTHKNLRGRFFSIFHSKLQLWTMPWSNLQSSADPHKQWHPSPLHRSLIFLQKHQASWHPKQTPPFFIIPLGFGDLGALFHYTATIISQRKLKSFNLWKALLPKSAAASYSWWCMRNGLNLAIVHAGHPLAIDDPQFSP